MKGKELLHFVHALFDKQDHNAPAMIVVVHPANIMSFAKTHGVEASADDLEHLCRDQKLNSEVLKELNDHGKKNDT